jgi:CRP-like cAMP-binding protein
VTGKTGNLLLDTLSTDLRDTILAKCRHMELPVRTLLHEQGEIPARVYFICSGIVSVVVTMAEGGSAEVGLIGREGLVGALQLLSPRPAASQAFVQLEGDGLRMAERT